MLDSKKEFLYSTYDYADLCLFMKGGDTMVELDPIRQELITYEKPLVEMGDSL